MTKGNMNRATMLRGGRSLARWQPPALRLQGYRTKVRLNWRVQAATGPRASSSFQTGTSLGNWAEVLEARHRRRVSR